MNYNIADINICINGLVKKELSIEIWSQFLSNNIFQDNVVINVVSRKSIDYQIERYFISDRVMRNIQHITARTLREYLKMQWSGQSLWILLSLLSGITKPLKR